MERIEELIARGHECLQTGDMAGANRAFNAALAFSPDDGELLYLVGATALACGDAAKARAHLENAVVAVPDHAAAHHDLALSLLKCGEPEGALIMIERAVDLSPEGAAYLHTRGEINERLGDSRAAKDDFTKCVETDVDFLPGLLNLARLWTDEAEYMEAETLLDRAQGLAPDHPVVMHNLGYLYRRTDRAQEAEMILRQLIDAIPEATETADLLAECLMDQGKYDAAAEICRAHLGRVPDAVTTLNTLALCLIAQGDLSAARDILDDATRLAPDDAKTRHNQSYIAFCQGDLESGWAHYEWSFAAGVRTPNRSFSAPRWQPGNDAHRRVLAWREQGIGDEVMFSACFQALERQCQVAIIECDPRLVSLFSRSFPAMRIMAEGTTPDRAFDAEIPQGSLAGLCWRSSEDFPASPHLLPDPERKEVWKARLNEISTRPKIGLSWTSGMLTGERRLWFSELSDWRPVLERDDIDVVCLQYGDVSAEIDALERITGRSMLRWHDLDIQNDIEELAALTANLDAALGATGFAMNLAAALGTPIIQVRRDPEPEYLRAWPSNARIVNRSWQRSWASCVSEVNDVLTERLSKAR